MRPCMRGELRYMAKKNQQASHAAKWEFRGHRAEPVADPGPTFLRRDLTSHSSRTPHSLTHETQVLTCRLVHKTTVSSAAFKKDFYFHPCLLFFFLFSTACRPVQWWVPLLKFFFTTVKEVLRPRQDVVSAVRGSGSLWEVGRVSRVNRVPTNPSFCRSGLLPKIITILKRFPCLSAVCLLISPCKLNRLRFFPSSFYLSQESKWVAHCLLSSPLSLWALYCVILAFRVKATPWGRARNLQERRRKSLSLSLTTGWGKNTWNKLWIWHIMQFLKKNKTLPLFNQQWKVLVCLWAFMHL